MEFMPNGDLSSNLEISARFPESIVRNILIQLLLALKELKKNNIIHGDIKLENVLYSAKDGIVKLADFGLSFEINTPNMSALGTPEYMAPELIMESRKGFESDIWAVGICAYEMLYGIPPFYDETAEKILSKIVNREGEIYFEASNISKSSKDLISKLLNFDYNSRITLEGAMKHEFFASVNWSKPPKIELPEFDSIFEERNKRYKSLQFYNKNTISTETLSYEKGIFNQKTSIENQIDLLKLFPIKNLNKLQS
jgi:serine/threonine protein kinase